jgi:hypothetical protein
MREPLEIIEGIKAFISAQNPFRFPHQEKIILDLLAELENPLTPVTEEPIIEEPILEEVIIEEVIVDETPIVEEVIEEPVVEEVVVKAPKRNARKK